MASARRAIAIALPWTIPAENGFALDCNHRIGEFHALTLSLIEPDHLTVSVLLPGNKRVLARFLRHVHAHVNHLKGLSWSFSIGPKEPLDFPFIVKFDMEGPAGHVLKGIDVAPLSRHS